MFAAALPSVRAHHGERGIPEEDRFQNRFHLGHLSVEPEDTVPVRFVFGTTDVPLDRRPRDTVLQRAVADHLREGGHWFVGRGWLPL
ncbi:hypothetical protein ACIBVL_01220 [Streptomyces sp. NPDC049687]|uniref:hypothetical protein n=1 Tax=Streptomyces sp. NPDC049687 TaxID=3365596 RepID=UPI0037B86220